MADRPTAALDTIDQPTATCWPSQADDATTQAVLQRAALLYGDAAMSALRGARVAVFGIGGVGGLAVEALARTGVGALDLIDFDVVDISNLNRQIWAGLSTVGQLKVEAAARRLADVCPQVTVRTYPLHVTADCVADLPFAAFDYVIDAVDEVGAKLAIIRTAKAQGVPVISSMGAGNKINPAAFQVADIAKTSVCPLARVVRRALKKERITGVKTVFSTETPVKPLRAPDAPAPVSETGRIGRRPPGSAMFAVAAAGLLIAAEVVSDLTGCDRTHTGEVVRD